MRNMMLRGRCEVSIETLFSLDKMPSCHGPEVLSCWESGLAARLVQVLADSARDVVWSSQPLSTTPSFFFFSCFSDVVSEKKAEY